MEEIMLKKSAVLFALTIPLCLFFSCLPQLIFALLPQTELTKLQTVPYTETIYTTGKLESVNQSTITAPIPIVPKAVYVSVGDTVTAGQCLATVDLEQTQQAITKMASLSSLLPDETVSVFAGNSIDLAKLRDSIPTQITADTTGTISDLTLSQGVVAYPTESLATISDLDTLRVSLDIPEETATRIAPSQSVTLTVSALGNQTYTATLTDVFPTAHETFVGTSAQTVVRCYAALTQMDDTLKAGYSVTGQIQVGDEQQLSCIPYTAVNQDDQGQEYVYLYQNGRALRRNITTGTELETVTEVISGLTPDDFVIADHNAVSKDGQFIRIKGAVYD